VESLLANDKSKDDVLAVAVANAVGQLPDRLMGQQIGPYVITELVGEGGMGRVYKARDTKLKREVALKVLPAAFVQDPDRMLRFQREAEVLASLNHPNIVVIYDAGSQHGLGVVTVVDTKKQRRKLTQLWLGVVGGLAWSSSSGEILFTAASCWCMWPFRARFCICRP
jgi:serine/threonine protein kinase